MNDRERFLETILFGRPDKVPFEPGWPRESTLAAWRQQGLPAGADWNAHLREVTGLPRAETITRVAPGVDFRMVPQFQEKIIERRERTLIVQDWKGNVCEIFDQFSVRHLREPIDFVTRRWICCPVQNRADWEAMKSRYRVDDPARFPEDFAQRCAALRQRPYPVAVQFAGPFWQLREWVGFEALCMLMLDDPQFVQDMVDFWRQFASGVLARLLAEVVPDVIWVSEDMAYKEKSMISPAMARRFLLPSWRQWTAQAGAAGVPIVDIDSDGYIGELIPLWIEAGVNACDPIEVAAGNDINAFRRAFGRKMAYRGGVDKRAMAKGGAVLRDELNRLAPVIRDGGYLPSCDHGVPSDVSWPNFVDYSRQLARLTDWL
jgi:uroporphyrinogen decarboxylase